MLHAFLAVKPPDSRCRKLTRLNTSKAHKQMHAAGTSEDVGVERIAEGALVHTLTIRLHERLQMLTPPPQYHIDQTIRN